MSNVKEGTCEFYDLEAKKCRTLPDRCDGLGNLLKKKTIRRSETCTSYKPLENKSEDIKK